MMILNPDGEWRPRSTRRSHKKPFGMRRYAVNADGTRRSKWSFTTWYRTERDRDNAMKTDGQSFVGQWIWRCEKTCRN